MTRWAMSRIRSVGDRSRFTIRGTCWNYYGAIGRDYCSKWQMTTHWTQKPSYVNLRVDDKKGGLHHEGCIAADARPLAERASNRARSIAQFGGKSRLRIG